MATEGNGTIARLVALERDMTQRAESDRRRQEQLTQLMTQLAVLEDRYDRIAKDLTGLGDNLRSYHVDTMKAIEAQAERIDALEAIEERRTGAIQLVSAAQGALITLLAIATFLAGYLLG